MAYNDLDEDLLGYAPPQDLTGDLPGAYANDEPIGGTGNEIAEQPFQPGFMYTGPVAGEAAARAQYQTPVGPLDYRGNAYAREMALQFDRAKAQYDAQRDIENAYVRAKNQQEMTAARSAEEFARQQNMQRAVANGTPYYQAALMFGGNQNRITGSTINAMRANEAPTLVKLGGQDFAREPNGRLVPIKLPDTHRTLSPGSAIFDKNTGEEIAKNPSAASASTVPMVNIPLPEITAEPAVPASTNWWGRVTPAKPAVEGRLPRTLRMPADKSDFSQAGVRSSMPESTVTPVGPVQKAVGGYKVGARYKGGLIYLGGDPKDPNSWDHGK